MRWKPIPDINYDISDSGLIRNRKTNRIIKPFLSTKGYLIFNCNNHNFRVHRLVAKAYLKQNANRPYVNHVDSDKTNNKVENLEWCTAQENTIHAVKAGKFHGGVGERQHLSKLTSNQVVNIRHCHRSISANRLAKLYKVTPQNIGKIWNRKTWKHI